MNCCLCELKSLNIISYLLDHACDTPGCHNVIVLDGNMKNARQVCMLKDAGELQFGTLPGTVPIGKDN